MDLSGVGEVARLDGLTFGVLVGTLLAGIRHGFDIDHVAAIGDIASSQQHRRRSFFLATTYALGHMVVVLALGAAAVIAGVRISALTDSIATRVIGLTLIALGGYVVYSLIRFRRDFRIMSRWMLVTAGVRRVLLWIRPPPHVVIEHEHEHGPGHHAHAHQQVIPPTTTAPAAAPVATVTHAHPHQHVVEGPSDPFTEYSGATSFLVGIVHGVGAETPTQMLLFTTAAGVAGAWGGGVVVVTFVAGLFLGNLLLTALTVSGFAAGRRMPLLYIGLAATTAAASIWIGAIYLLGRTDLLPWLLGH